MTSHATDRGRGGGVTKRLGRLGLLVSSLLLAGILLVACGEDEAAPEVPAAADGTVDPALEQGREIWAARCARCHGADGGGRSAPRVNDGRMVERYPVLEDQVAYVAQGRGGMPGFGNALSDDELLAVVRYTREVLGEVS